MKLKKLLAFGLALVMCLAMAACGANPDEKPEESTSQTDEIEEHTSEVQSR